MKRPDLEGLQAQLQSAVEPLTVRLGRRNMNQAVETALTQLDPQAPEGVTAADWERVVQARQAETSARVKRLRRLGPQVQSGEVVASVDEIEVRRPEKRRFLQLGTAGCPRPAGLPVTEWKLRPGLASVVPAAEIVWRRCADQNPFAGRWHPLDHPFLPGTSANLAHGGSDFGLVSLP